MKIGYLIQQFPPEIGAGPARAGEFAEHWLRWGAEVEVLTGFPNRPEGRIFPDYRGRVSMREAWNGMDIHRSWLYAAPEPGFLGTLANNLSFMVSSVVNSALRAPSPDVLIASSPPFFVHLAGVVLSRLWRVPLVLEVRDLWPDYLVSMGVLRNRFLVRALFGLERLLLARAERCVVVTESFRRRLTEKGVAEDRILVVPNAVDPDHYRPAPADPPVASLTPESGAFRIGYLGNFGTSQDLPRILQAARLLREDGPVRLVLVGGGTDGERVRSCVEEMDLDWVSVHPPIPKERTRDFYNSCDLCLVPLAPAPALQDTIPSKLFEILACGRPVLLSARGEAARVVEESGAGLVVEPGDAEAIAAGIDRIRRLTSAARREMGARGRAYVQRWYSREVQGRKYFDMLSGLVGRAGKEDVLPNETTRTKESRR